MLPKVRDINGYVGYIGYIRYKTAYKLRTNCVQTAYKLRTQLQTAYKLICIHPQRDPTAHQKFRTHAAYCQKVCDMDSCNLHATVTSVTNCVQTACKLRTSVTRNRKSVWTRYGELGRWNTLPYRGTTNSTTSVNSSETIQHH